MTNLEVLYEDNHIIAINKKPSDIVQADKTGDKALNEIVKDYIKEKYNKPGEVYLGIVHRIDRPVSGVVLFAKTSKAASRLSELFKTKNIGKTYWAVVDTKPKPTEGRLKNYINKNTKVLKAIVYDEPMNGALEATLDYKLLKSLDNYHLLEVKPITGRYHQIRSQLAAKGWKIKGDIKYGARRKNDDRSIHLHARQIDFIHPVKKEPISITAPTPNEVIWNACL